MDRLRISKSFSALIITEPDLSVIAALMSSTLGQLSATAARLMRPKVRRVRFESEHDATRVYEARVGKELAAQAGPTSIMVLPALGRYSEQYACPRSDHSVRARTAQGASTARSFEARSRCPRANSTPIRRRRKI